MWKILAFIALIWGGRKLVKVAKSQIQSQTDSWEILETPRRETQEQRES